MSRSAPASPTSSFRIRPRFEQILPQAPEVVQGRILEALAGQSDCIEVKSYPGFVGIHICGDERRRWSPQLHLSLDTAAEGGTRVIGVYGPELEYWGSYLYSYVFCGLIGLFAGIFGFAQFHIGQTPWGWWVTGGMLVLVGLLYLLAQLGQKLASGQTFRLHRAYYEAVGVAPETCC